MTYTYRTHYRPDPCGRVGFNSSLSDNLDDVNCMWCRAKHGKYPIKIEVKRSD